MGALLVLFVIAAVSLLVVRRRIIRDLIFAGNVGLTSALATLIVTFVQTSGTKQTLTTMGIIFGGLVVLLVISRRYGQIPEPAGSHKK